MVPEESYPEILRRIAAATRKAIHEMREKRPDEHFYSFALCSDLYGQYVVAMADSTEELKARAERRFAEGDRYSSLEAAEKAWRWFFGDWLYRDFGEKEFKGVNALLPAFDKWPKTDSGKNACEQHAARLHEICMQVLSELNEEGVFGTGEDRSNITVLMILAEIGNKWIVERAYRLNSKEIAERFDNDFTVRVEKEGRWQPVGSKNVYHQKRIAHSADRSVVATLGSNLFVCRRNADGGWTESLLMHWIDSFGGLAVSPDGATLVAATSKDRKPPHELVLFDLTAGKAQEEKRWSAAARILSLSFSPDGRWLAGGGQSERCFIWDANTGDVVAGPVVAAGTWVREVQFTPDGTMLATAGSHLTQLWRTSDWTEVRAFEMPSKRIAISPDGRLLAMCGQQLMSGIEFENESTLAIGELATGKMVGRIARDEQIDSATFSHDGRLVAVGGHKSGVSVKKRLKADRDKSGGADFNELVKKRLKARQEEALSNPNLSEWVKKRLRAILDGADQNAEHGDPADLSKPSRATLTLYDVESGQVKSRLICGMSEYDDVAFLDDHHVSFAGFDNDGSPPLGIWSVELGSECP